MKASFHLQIHHNSVRISKAHYLSNECVFYQLNFYQVWKFHLQFIHILLYKRKLFAANLSSSILRYQIFSFISRRAFRYTSISQRKKLLSDILDHRLLPLCLSFVLVSLLFLLKYLSLMLDIFQGSQWHGHLNLYYMK